MRVKRSPNYSGENKTGLSFPHETEVQREALADIGLAVQEHNG